VFGALLVGSLAVAGFTCGRLRASGEPEQSTAARDPAPVEVQHGDPRATAPGASPAPAVVSASVPAAPPAPASSAPAAVASALSPISFVAIEVEPRAAQIWLDRQLTGTGRIELGAIHDGMLHELRFMAPGHETKTLFFRDTPPAGRVLLKRVPASAGATEDGAAVADEALPSVSEEDSASAGERDTVPGVPRRAVRRRAAAAPAAAPPPPAPAPTRAHPVAENPASAAPPAVKKAPRVELIEVHTPRVQVLD
jgi:hypothetical protein